MSCSSCVATITDMLSRLPGVSDVVVSLLTNSATLHLESMFLLSSVTDTIDDCGFQVELISADPIQPPTPAASSRTISLRVDGMHCQYVPLVSARILSRIPIRHCPRKILDALHDLFPRISITKPFADHTNPIIEISYEPAPPDFTVRTIISRILSVDPAFTVSPHHPPTLEQRTRTMQLHEQSIILNRLLFTLVIAIPAFIIGVVYMSLVPSGHPSKAYLMEPMWNGNASRIQWSMFFLATPVMFYGAALFHRRSIKEIVATWRKGSSTPIITRFTRFGSMNLLVIVCISPSVLATHPSS
jgi:Cu+-exporting ATPase